MLITLNRFYVTQWCIDDNNIKYIKYVQEFIY